MIERVTVTQHAINVPSSTTSFRKHNYFPLVALQLPHNIEQLDLQIEGELIKESCFNA